MSYDPIPLLEQTVGHLEARRVEIAERLALHAAPAYEQTLDMPGDDPEPVEVMDDVGADSGAVDLPI